MEGLIVVFIIILIAVVAAMAHSIGDEPKKSDNKLVMGDDFIASSTTGPERKNVYIHTTEPTKKGAIDHVVSTIHMCPEKNGVWVCPNCECENHLSVANCCVCHKPK